MMDLRININSGFGNIKKTSKTSKSVYFFINQITTTIDLEIRHLNNYCKFNFFLF